MEDWKMLLPTLEVELTRGTILEELNIVNYQDFYEDQPNFSMSAGHATSELYRARMSEEVTLYLVVPRDYWEKGVTLITTAPEFGYLIQDLPGDYLLREHFQVIWKAYEQEHCYVVSRHLYDRMDEEAHDYGHATKVTVYRALKKHILHSFAWSHVDDKDTYDLDESLMITDDPDAGSHLSIERLGYDDGDFVLIYKER